MAIKKITLPDNTTQDIQDSRIPGVDSTPTSGSSNLVTSGGVYTALSSKADDSGVVHKAGDTMTGDLKLTDGEYIQSAAGSNMCGMSASKEFLIGAGFEETDGFIVCTGDHGITHRRYEDATTYHDWYVWDAGNLNRNDCNFTVKDLYIANHIHLPNNKHIYIKDSSGTERRAMYISTSNNLIIGIDQNGLGNTYLYGNNIAFRPTNTSTTVATISPTGVTVDSGDLTVASPSNVAFSSTSNTLADIIPNITVSSSEPTSSQGSDGDIWIVV